MKDKEKLVRIIAIGEENRYDRVSRKRAYL